MIPKGIRLAACSAATLWALSLLLGCTLTSPIALSAASSSAPPLAGNWLLTGTLPTGAAFAGASQPPTSVVTVDVSGGNVTAAGYFGSPCATGAGLASTGYGAMSANLSGTLQPGGTFTLYPPPTYGPPAFSISGTAPAAVGGAWSGTVTVTGSFPANGQIPACNMAQTVPFTATPMADVTGTFTGSGNASFSPLPGTSGSTVPSVPLSITTTLTQGAPLYSLNGVVTAASSRLGRSGTIDVQGISCFKHGTTTGTGGAVEANQIFTNFLMDDGSMATLSATIQDVAVDELGWTALSVNKGSCPGLYTLPLLHPTPLKKQ